MKPRYQITLGLVAGLAFSALLWAVVIYAAKAAFWR